MAEEWQTLAEAGQTLEISQRTLYRRIDKGDIESKLEDGKRLIRVILPDDNEVTDNLAAMADTVAEVSAKEDIERLNAANTTLEQELERLREELHTAEKKVALVDELTKDKEYLQGQNDKLQEEMSVGKERSDTIILQLTRQNQLLLEDKSQPWYRRWLKRRKEE